MGRRLRHRDAHASRNRRRRRIAPEGEYSVEGKSDESEFLYAGRHEGQAPEIDGSVFLALDEGVAAPRPGDLVRARVTGADGYDLAARSLGIR